MSSDFSASVDRGKRPVKVFGSGLRAVQIPNLMELQINAYWATRPSHFVLLNAQKLRDTQHMMQQILLSLVHALYEGNPQPVFANTEKLNDAVEELRQLLNNHHDLKVVETPIYGYV